MGGINVNDGFETILEREVLVYGYSISIVQGKNTPLIYVTAYHKFFTQKVFMLLCNVNAARDRRVDCTIKIWLWHTMLLDNEQPSREQIHSEQCLHIYVIFIFPRKYLLNIQYFSLDNRYNFSLSTRHIICLYTQDLFGLFTVIKLRFDSTQPWENVRLGRAMARNAMELDTKGTTKAEFSCDWSIEQHLH